MCIYLQKSTSTENKCQHLLRNEQSIRKLISKAAEAKYQVPESHGALLYKWKEYTSSSDWYTELTRSRQGAPRHSHDTLNAATSVIQKRSAWRYRKYQQHCTRSERQPGSQGLHRFRSQTDTRTEA